MSNYNKYTPTSIKLLGCSQCAQKRGRHAKYCPFYPERQALRAEQAERNKSDLRFIDLWNAIASLKQEIIALREAIEKR